MWLVRPALCVLAALCSTAFAATDWRPEKPIEIIVGTPPGGPLDITARLIQSTLERRGAGVPTWRELGVNAVTPNWRAVVGPKTMPAAHAHYWDQTLGAMVKSPEWREAMRKNYWEDDYLNSAGALKFMQEEYRQLEALLTELGDAKRP